MKQGRKESLVQDFSPITYNSSHLHADRSKPRLAISWHARQKRRESIKQTPIEAEGPILIRALPGRCGMHQKRALHMHVGGNLEIQSG